jgi:phosphopantetheinyl transferase (holo-ACP synthase)
MSQVYLCFAKVPDAEASGSGDESPLKGAFIFANRGLAKANSPDEVWLTPREARMLAEIKSPRRRRDWLAGRCAAKELIRSYLLERAGLALARSHIEILNDENGAPRVLLWEPVAEATGSTGGSPLKRAIGACFSTLPSPEPADSSAGFQLSIAHSGGHGLAGLCAHSPLGVDLQQIRPVRPDLARRVLSAHERAQLDQHFAGDSLEGTLVFWALKEAAIKVHRARPAPALCEIAVRLTEPGHAEILVRSQRLQAQWGRWKEFIWAWAVL